MPKPKRQASPLAREFSVLRARAEQNAAERDAALGVLRELVAYVERVGGYMPHKDQETVRGARMLLAAHGKDLP